MDKFLQQCDAKRAWRVLYLLIGSVVMISTLLWLDPDPGAPASLVWLHRLGLGVLVVGISHLTRKWVFPYFDWKEAARVAQQGTTGAGLALLANAVVFVGLLLVFAGFAKAATVPILPTPTGTITAWPAAANQHLPTLVAEQKRFFANHPMPTYLAGLIEHESCVSLASPRCWQPTSRLKTQREEGAGLGQLTRTWRSDGRLRFDTLAELRQRHVALSELSWSNVYSRADLQLRAVVLKTRDDYQALSQITLPLERLAMADSAYNGGMAGLQSDRRACALKPGCDTLVWWSNVERTCTKSRAALYGQRSACDINRHHVRDVITVRAPRYATAWVQA